jgi:hypothetical protein
VERQFQRGVGRNLLPLSHAYVSDGDRPAESISQHLGYQLGCSLTWRLTT